jgi:hypothetical protein
LRGHAELDQVQSNRNRCIEQVGIAYNNDINALKNTLEDNRKAAKLKIRKEKLEGKCIERTHAELDQISIKYAVLDLEPDRCEWNLKNPLHLNHYCLEHLPEAMKKAQKKPNQYVVFKSDLYAHAEKIWERCVLSPFLAVGLADTKEHWNMFCSVEFPRIQTNMQSCKIFPTFGPCDNHAITLYSMQKLCRHFTPRSQSTALSQT